MVHRTLVSHFVVVAALSAGCRNIPEPGQREGGDRIVRTLLCDLPEIGDIRNLVWLRDDTGGDGRLWIGGENGAVQATRDGDVRDLVVFSRRNVNPLPIDVDGDGELETMNGSRGWADVGLFDAAGRALWSFPRGGPAADAMAAGPIGEEGEIAFVVGLNAGGGVHFLDARGHVFRRYHSSNAFSVAVVDLDGDGSVEVLHSDGRGFSRWIQIRDGEGCPLRRLDLDFEAFGVVRWPDANGPPCLFGGDEDTVQIVDPCAKPEGELLAELELPDEGFSVADGQVLPVRLDPTDEPYIAVQRTIRATWHRSALYVFDPQRRLVYREVFPFGDMGIAVVPSGDEGAGAIAADQLLVGAGSTVSRYELRSLLPAPEPQPVPK